MDEEQAGERRTVAEGATRLVGRDAELARLFRTVDAAGSADPVLVLLGDVGIGKSALLERAVRRAEARGTRVLRATGSESESHLAFSALHLLLRPVADETDSLPERQRTALHAAFGTGPAPSEPTAMLIGMAVLDLLSGLGERGPVLVVLDDAQWFDRASLDALSFAVRRLADEPFTMLLAARTGDGVPGFDHHVPTLAVGALDDEAAGRLLDEQPQGVRVSGPRPKSQSQYQSWSQSRPQAPLPSGRKRKEILDQAEGNPLALIELTRAATTGAPVSVSAHGTTAQESAGPGPAPGPLPLTAHLERVFAARLNDLPTSTARALLLFAAMDTVDSATAAVAALPDVEDETWLPAERAGLIRKSGPDAQGGGSGLRFSHPLVRSAAYHAASLDARREAHEALAARLGDEPDRRAWHRAAAATGPDAGVAAELEQTAERARRRGGHAAAASALRRAADLAPGREEGARLLVAATGQAVLTGDLAWAEELAAGVRARTDDPALLAETAAHVGRLATLTVRHHVVFSRLADAAAELTTVQPVTALDLLAGAAVTGFYSGRDDQRRRVRDLLEELPPDASPAWLRAWVRTVADPFDDRADLLSLVPQVASEARGRPDRLTAFAVMAWLLDETPQAVRAFDEAFDRWGTRGPLPDGLGGAAAWTYVEQGRWARAQEACARSGALGSATGLDHTVACAAAVEAMVLAHQGDTAAARERATTALALIDPLESRSVAVYARRALGAAALADGAHDTAYDQLRKVFTADGAPVHYHASYPALADLAAAAVRSGHREEALTIVERAARTLAENASPRLRALIERARGLLADAKNDEDPRAPNTPQGSGDAESHFRAALADPVLVHWPFEYAQVLLDLAEWLRRRRRIAEARGPLAEALEIFQRLGAHPWAERARTEARAAGLGVTGTAPAPGALAELSPQQRQIVGLAARGMTNREIGERLFLSPRTVGSHLYRSFPKLGITARSQLRDLVEGAVTAAGHQG
ncbi:AAA family ATPase [Streptomyces sp. NPDC087300]|uniref:AAA family ATPase n=1 Tax=Streptomyces sp. NPDC087300 TaxID=3365780 RepID=UPI0038191378